MKTKHNSTIEQQNPRALGLLEQLAEQLKYSPRYQDVKTLVVTIRRDPSVENLLSAQDFILRIEGFSVALTGLVDALRQETDLPTIEEFQAEKDYTAEESRRLWT